MTRTVPTPRAEVLLKIGEIARRAGVTLRTIRYYQALGLIRAACRTPGGMRLFRPETIDRARLIRDLRRLDVPLAQIKALLQAQGQAATGAERARVFGETLSRSLAEAEQRLLGYQGLRENLVRALATLQSCRRCDRPPSPASCRRCQNLAHREAVPVYIRALVA